MQNLFLIAITNATSSAACNKKCVALQNLFLIAIANATRVEASSFPQAHQPLECLLLPTPRIGVFHFSELLPCHVFNLLPCVPSTMSLTTRFLFASESRVSSAIKSKKLVPLPFFVPDEVNSYPIVFDKYRAIPSQVVMMSCLCALVSIL